MPFLQVFVCIDWHNDSYLPWISLHILFSFLNYLFLLHIIETSPPSFTQASNTPNQVVAGKSPDSASPHTKKTLEPIWQTPPPGSKMPPLETFKLTKELFQHRVKDNVIVVTFGNFAFMDFILSWVKSLTDMGVDNLLVGTYSLNSLTMEHTLQCVS